MITRESYLAKCDQEVSTARDQVNSMVQTYARNMAHIESCEACDEIDNISRLIADLLEGPNKPTVEFQAAHLAVAIKMLHDERAHRNADLP